MGRCTERSSRQARVRGCLSHRNGGEGSAPSGVSSLSSAARWRFVVHGCCFCGGSALPAFIRVEALHLPSEYPGVRTEVLLEHSTIVVYKEGHHTARVVLCRVCNHCEAAHQFALREVAVRAALCVRPLLVEDAEEISVIWAWLARRSHRIAFCPGLGEKGPEWALRLVRRGRPVEPVALAVRALEVARVVEE